MFMKKNLSCFFTNLKRDWKRSVFIPIPKKGNAKECSNYRTIALITLIAHSVQFSRSVVQFSRSDSLRPHESQHTRPPCPSPTPGVHSNSCPSRRWCHPAISSSVVPFSSCPQSFPESEFFPVSWLFASGGHSIGASASISPSSEYSGLISFRIEWFNLLVVQETYLSVKKSEFSGEDGNLFPNCQWFTCLRDRSSIWILLAMVAFFLWLCVCTHDGLTPSILSAPNLFLTEHLVLN